jgi:hypothetical protein
MSSVTSCVGGGLFICFTCLHVPYSTVTVTTIELSRRRCCSESAGLQYSLPKEAQHHPKTCCFLLATAAIGDTVIPAVSRTPGTS